MPKFKVVATQVSRDLIRGTFTVEAPDADAAVKMVQEKGDEMDATIRFLENLGAETDWEVDYAEEVV